MIYPHAQVSLLWSICWLYEADRSTLGTLFPPLLIHTSHSSETHYYPLSNRHNGRILLHTHLGAPFIDHTRHLPSHLNITIISSADSACQEDFASFEITVDWSATLGRWAPRYLHTLVSWAAGVASLVVFCALAQVDAGGECLCIIGTRRRLTTDRSQL